MANRTPRPLQQGELDGLCGIYSLINGLTWALHTRRAVGDRISRRATRLRQAEYEALFVALLECLYERRQTATPVVNGMSSVDLAFLIRRSSRWLKERRELEVVAFRPFYHRRRVYMGRIARALSAHLAEPGRTAIIGLDAPWDHWTTVAGVTPWRWNLLDSSGSVHLCLKRQPLHCDAHIGVLRPSSVFLLSVGPPA